jgi:hypothetical protein
VYKGRIVSAEDGNGVDNAILQLLDAGGKIVGFTFSGSDGSVSVAIPQRASTALFKLLGYQDRSMPIGELLALKDGRVELAPSSVDIREVRVSAPPIVQRSDTIAYNVASFKGQEDRYISDVLKKLPGITVDGDGKISYLGEAISKLYVEGRDLLGGQYGLATNNLSADAVGSVEVMEHHQPIRALQGVKFAEQAALNLKLKKGYTIRPFGEVRAGVGGTPLLYSSSAFMGLFHPKAQAVANLKGGNTGHYILGEMGDRLFGFGWFFEPLPGDMISAPAPRSVPLPQERHLFNRTYLGSASTLVPLSKFGELKVSVAHGNDVTEQNYSLLQHLATGSDTLNILEQSGHTRRTGSSRVSAAYELNSTHAYLQDEAVYSQQRVSTRSALMPVDYTLSNASKLYYMQNGLQGLLKFEGGKTLEVKSFLRYVENDEGFDGRIATAQRSTLAETFNTRTLATKNRVEGGVQPARSTGIPRAILQLQVEDACK